MKVRDLERVSVGRRPCECVVGWLSGCTTWLAFGTITDRAGCRCCCCLSLFVRHPLTVRAISLQPRQWMRTSSLV